MALGLTHEWFALDGAAADDDAPRKPERGTGARRDRRWFAPLCLLADSAARVLAALPSRALVVWIGDRCRPYAPLLARWPDLARASVFVEPPDTGARLWALDAAARCASVAAVIGDGSGLNMAATRRLTLAIGAGGGWCALARPPGDMGQLSACATRWVVSPAPWDGYSPRWSVALVRDKAATVRDGPRRWLVEWNDEAGAVGVSAGVGGAAGAAPVAVRARITA